MKVTPIRKDLADHFRRQAKRIAELEKQAGITDEKPWQLNEPEWAEVETIIDNISCLCIRFNIPVAEYQRQIQGI